RADHEMRVRVAAPEDLDDVADRRAVERGDDPDLPRQRRERPLPRGVEQPFCLQPLFELIEGELQRAEAVRLEMLADELVLAFWFVHRDPAPRHDAQSVRRLELQIAQGGSEDHRLDLRGAVLEREIQMAGVPDSAVRQLAFDPDLEEFLFEEVADA